MYKFYIRSCKQTKAGGFERLQLGLSGIFVWRALLILVPPRHLPMLTQTILVSVCKGSRQVL